MMIIIVCVLVILILLFVFSPTLEGVMMQSYNNIKRRYPGMSEDFYLKEALRMRFRRWPDFQLELFVSDCSNINELISKIRIQEAARMI